MSIDLSLLKNAGKGIKMHEYVRIIYPQNIEIGDGTQIDDFVLINGGTRTVIGRWNHIASFVSVVGGGELITEDYVGIAAGVRIITGTHHYGDGRRISPLIEEEKQFVIRGIIYIEQDVFIGSNAVIFPNIRIGEGAIVGAGAIVLKDIESWGIYAGMPARKIGMRPKIKDYVVG
jgi:acetyltransferase-like isoleucine patch superfamily enzyme